MEKKEELVESKSQITFKSVLHRYFIKAMNGMAMGLFASLIIGTIINLLAKLDVEGIFKLKDFYDYLVKSNLPGAAIGIGVALALKNKNMVILASAGVGYIGYLGGPVGAFISAVVGCELGALVAGKTKVDIIITPLVVILTGGIIGLYIGSPIQTFLTWIGNLISQAAELNPIIMGILLAVVVGIILTSPISSVAICVSLNLSGLAAGAACVGCCTNMIGFAICGYKKNGIGGMISVGLGTSMLLFPNLLKKPLIWLPVIIASAILGPISSAVLGMVNTAGGAGMGTSGLVGQFSAIEAMSELGGSFWIHLVQIIGMHFVAPIILVWAINFVFKKLKWIKDEDYQLSQV